MTEAAQEEAEQKRPVSAIVVSYFTGPLLTRTLASLKAQPDIGEIVLVDNGNWAGAVVEAVAALPDGAPVEVISGHGNIGFAAACNLAARRAQGRFLLFLNPDATLPAGAAAQLLNDGKELERPWVMGCKLVGADGLEQQGSRRATLTPWRALVEVTKLYKLAPRHPYFRRFNLHGEPCPKEVSPMPVVSGACFFLPREDYFLIGGMDERYRLHVEDVDFCLRFAGAGGGAYFNPHVSVTHVKSSSRANPLRVEFRKTESALRYFRRHFSDAYPAGFHLLVAVALWSAFGLKACTTLVGRAVGYAVIIRRTGPYGARRAASLASKRSSR
jgi:N-acetylglucosaminyl-diphospho-decaprenol L-rhamnosyltransferase